MRRRRRRTGGRDARGGAPSVAQVVGAQVEHLDVVGERREQPPKLLVVLPALVAQVGAREVDAHAAVKVEAVAVLVAHVVDRAVPRRRARGGEEEDDSAPPHRTRDLAR